MLKEPVQLLSTAPRTQMCMGRHLLPFKFRADVSWSKLEYVSSGSSSSSSSASDGMAVSPDALLNASDDVKSTLEVTPTSSQWMLPTTHWNHAEDVAVYVGTARNASVHVQYMLECTSLCAVRGSVAQLVSAAEISILGSIDPWSLHAPSLQGAYCPVPQQPDEAVKLRAKLNRRTYSRGESISIHFALANRFSAPVKEVRFSLLNSAMIRDQNSDSALPTLHTTAITSITSEKTQIAPGSNVEDTITLTVPDAALPRWSALLHKNGDAKVRIETVLRITIVVENYQDHIFQTTLSISPKPRGLNEDKELNHNEHTSAQTSSGNHTENTRESTNAKQIIWVKDKEAARCAHCTGVFSFLHMKHHCRGCGLIVCADHSKSIAAPKLFGLKPRRVCKTCETLIISNQLTSSPVTKPNRLQPETTVEDKTTQDQDLPVVRVPNKDDFASQYASIQLELDSPTQSIDEMATKLNEEP